MDPARELFDRLAAGGENALVQLVDDQQEENLLLDFKRAETGHGPMSKADRKNLAEALSGFANSDGGLIIWGIDCRSTQNEPDTAKAVKPIAQLKEFMSSLQTNTPASTSPGIIGVEHAPILAAGQPDAGYVMTYIPKGEDEPHMAIGSGQHAYYFRSGSSFLPMEAFMVADRYKRRPQPRLELDVRVEGLEVRGKGVAALICIGIRNVGKGIALYPALVLTCKGCEMETFALEGHRGSALRRRTLSGGSGGDPVIFAGGVDDAIHPGTAMEVARLSACGPVDASDGDNPLSGFPPICIDYELHCDGFATHGRATLTNEDIAAGARRP